MGTASQLWNIMFLELLFRSVFGRPLLPKATWKADQCVIRIRQLACRGVDPFDAISVLILNGLTSKPNS